MKKQRLMSKQEFEKRLLEMQDDMLRSALRLTNDRSEADDLVQETTLRALDKSKQFVEDISFRGWIMTMMRNIFLNNMERTGRKREMIDSSVDVYNVALLAEGSHYAPDAAFNLKEINAYIDELNELNRVPFRMFLDGNKYTEIAEKLGLPVGTVKSRIFLARRQLQENSELRRLRSEE